MAGYRIGYLNPWSNAAENHASASLEIAAQRLGHLVLPVTNSDELLAASADFVIAVASTQPRLTQVPTFANIHEPRSRWWENEDYFRNLLTYDGFLTISDTLRDFTRAVCSGFGKHAEIGEFFSTPQCMRVQCDIPGLVAREGLRLCYFGTNWDPRSRPLFRQLAKRDYVQIRGPQASWSYLPAHAYCGSVPFDGMSVQMVYAAHGAGLIVHSHAHTLDDVVSNRVFEITSVGAAAVAPDMPWLRSRFGDTLHYYDPWLPAASLARQVDEIIENIRARPQEAAEMAAGARKIFEKRYAAEVMLGRAVAYFEDWKAQKAALRRPHTEQPLIDVIVRVGGRPLNMIARTLKSIDAQSMGRFRIIFVRYREIDLAPLMSAPWRNIEGFEVVDRLGGNRSKTLSAGLSALRSPYFAVLDDDDVWLPDHVETIWRLLKQAPRDEGFVYCGFIHVDESGDADRPAERRRITELSPATGKIWDIVGKFGASNWIASRDLLEGLDLRDWVVATAEDTITVCHLISRAPTPAFSWRATLCVSTSADGSGHRTRDLRRQEDVLEAFLRIGPRIEDIERKFAPTPSSTWSWIGTRLSEVVEARSRAAFREEGRLVLEDGMLSVALSERGDSVTAHPIDLATQLSLNPPSHLSTGSDGARVNLQPSPAPWGYLAAVDIASHAANPATEDREVWAVIEFDTVAGAFGIGLLNAAKSDFVVRLEVPRRAYPVELWLRIPDPGDVSQFVIQNWGPGGGSAILRNLWIVEG